MLQLTAMELDAAEMSTLESGVPEISIIIVNWRSADFVLRCVRSIRDNLTDFTYEVIVVDNASFDGCDGLLRKNGLAVSYLQSDENLGFAKANNRAFRACRGSSLLFLNPDTETVGPAISLLHRELWRLPTTATVGARLLNADGSLQTSCIQAFPNILNQALDSEYLRRIWPASRLWGTRAFLHNNGRPEAVEAISGACLMIKRGIFEQVGGFNEDYFMYGEDMDLCHRVRAAGFKNLYVPQATVIHFGGSSSKQAPSNFATVMIRESISRFIRTTRGDLYGTGYRFAMLLSAVCRLGILSLSLLARWLDRSQPSQNGSFRKWWAILRWSLSPRFSPQP
jgi:N-acetylglucosaminyl-diphospho-decaprenol L-rhamnosyltransferase